MWRLLEGGYYLFKLYRNEMTIRGRLLFEVQTPRLLFISAKPQCGDYSRVATIRSTDVAATIYFSSTAMRRLFEGSYYSKYRRRGYYLFQLYRNAATIRGRLLFEVQTSRLLFISALPQCDDYSRAATIRSTDVAATIYFSSTAMRRLFEGGYYSKYRRRGHYLFQLYRNAATIRGWLLFKVRHLFKEIQYSFNWVAKYGMRQKNLPPKKLPCTVRFTLDRLMKTEVKRLLNGLRTDIERTTHGRGTDRARSVPFYVCTYYARVTIKFYACITNSL